MNRKIALFIITPVILTVLLTTAYVFQANSLRKAGNKTLFQLSFSDLDFDNEITSLSENGLPVSAVYEVAGSDEFNRVRSWGIVRAKNNETPKADPGAPELLKKYNGIYIADTDKPVIYLTFDEGYEAGYTAGILDCLKKHNVNAIFHNRPIS